MRSAITKLTMLDVMIYNIKLVTAKTEHKATLVLKFITTHTL
jgi:hypothetical protein